MIIDAAISCIIKIADFTCTTSFDKNTLDPCERSIIVL